MRSYAKILILTGGKISGKSYAAEKAQKKFGVAVIERDEAISDVKTKRSNRIAELQLRKGTAKPLFDSGFLDESETCGFLRNWYEQRLSNAKCPVIVAEGWFFNKLAQRKILYQAAAAVFDTCSYWLVYYEPSDEAAAERFEKEKDRPPKFGEIKSRRIKNRCFFEERHECEQNVKFMELSELDQVLDLVESMRDLSPITAFRRVNNG